MNFSFFGTGNGVLTLLPVLFMALTIMGASVASLPEVLEQWTQIQEDENIVIDMSRVTIVNPFFILPLCALVSANAKRSDKIKFEIPSKIGSYLQTIHFPNGFCAAVTDDWEDQISGYAGKSYLPACKFPVSVNATSKREQFLATFEQILLKQLNLKGQIITVIKRLWNRYIAQDVGGWIKWKVLPVFGRCILHLH